MFPALFAAAVEVSKSENVVKEGGEEIYSSVPLRV